MPKTRCDQLATSRTQCQPDRNLSSTSQRTRQQQVRDVRTGNEQDEQHGTDKREQRGLNVPNNPFLQQDAAGRGIHFCSRKVPGQATSDPLQCGRGHLRRQRVL
jgi:hypothetical protein